ncbi:exo-alpha-sialidase [Tichowtungia aerotolerans]|uniref:Sialidase domain-containing protein n=1 Tax=Tichowtungia aerotolerans TaxID=2697043 RepID=A0A6P1MAE0_9BACT|nr:exo-alpha-sialidase [Tichowtungia aerotolerans]QHI68536.1 hypothetical protein GT409_03390 [Tichowtungia aerotolerans]
MNSLPALGQVPELWTGPNLPHNVRDVPSVSSATYVAVHQAVRGEDQFLLGASIVEHNGILYANWANGPRDENSNAERVCGKTSTDGGLTWSDKEVIVPSLPGTLAHSHGPYISYNGQLWFFGMRFEYAPDGAREVNTEAFLLNEQTGEWESFGIVAAGGGMVDAPVRMANGNWIVGAVYTGFWACAFISHGDDFTRWDRVPVPIVPNHKCSETTILVYDDKLIAVMRSSFPGAAGISVSQNYGRSWSAAQASDFSMVQSKPFGGVLSNGQPYLIANVSDGGGNDRDTLVIAVGQPATQSFCRMWTVRRGRTPQPLLEGLYKTPGWHYPYAYEYNGNLYVIYALGKEDCELAIIPISALNTSGSIEWVAPATDQLFAAVTWDGSVSSDWTNGQNWECGSMPVTDFTTDIAEFVDSAAVLYMPTINASRNIHGVDFDSGGWTVGSNGTSTWGIGSAGITFAAEGALGVNAIHPNLFLASDQCWTVSAGNTLVVTNGSVTGARTLCKAGGGKLVLAGRTNAMAGVVVSNGTLAVNSSAGFSAPVSVCEGAVLSGNGTIGAPVSVSDGGVLEPGDGGPGALSMSGLALSSNSVLRFQLDGLSGSSDRVVVGDLVLDGLLDVSDADALEEGGYTLFVCSGAVTDNGLQVRGMPSGFKGSVSVSAGVVSLAVTGPVVWDGSNNSDWTYGANWDSGVMPVNDFNTEVARFGNASVVPNMPAINASRSIGGVQFSDSGWTVGWNGSSLWGIGGEGVVSAGAGTNWIQSAVYLGADQAWDVAAGNTLVADGRMSGAGRVFEKAGEGTLVLAGSNSVAQICVSAGTLLVNSPAGFCAPVSVSNHSVFGGTGVVDGVVSVLGGGTVSPGDQGSGVLNVSELVLDAESRLVVEVGPSNEVDRIETGNLTLDGVLDIVALGDISPGSYTLISFDGVLSDNGLEMGDVPYGFVGEISVVSTAVCLNVFAAPDVAVWDGSNNTDWTYGQNWVAGAMPFSDYYSALARFEGSAAVLNMPVINASRNVNAVHFAGSGWTVGSNGASVLGIGCGGVVVSDGESGGFNVVESRVHLGDGQDWFVSAGNTLVAAGSVGGAASSLTKTGPGRLILSGAQNSYGVTVVAEGTLLVDGVLDSRAAGVSVRDAAIFGGTGTVHRSVEVFNGGILAPGGNGAGELTVSNLTLGSSSVLDFELGSAGGCDQIGAADLVLDGRLRVTDSGGLSAGTYTLITYSGALTDNGLELRSGALPYGFEGSLSVSGGAVRLTLRDVVAWDGSNNTDWTNGSNWETGVMPVSSFTSSFAKFVNSQDVAFQPAINASRNICGVDFLGAGWEVGSNGSSVWGIGSGGISSRAAESGGTNTIQSSLYLGDDQAWTIEESNIVEIHGNIGGASSTLTKSGAGALVLFGANNGYGNTVVSSGTLLVNGVLDSRAATVSVGGAAVLGGSGTIDRSVAVAGGGTLSPGDGGAGTLTLSSLALNDTSVLDFELGGLPGSNDSVAVDSLVLDGLLNVSDFGGLQEGTYTLFSCAGALTDNGLQVGQLPVGFAGTVAVSNGVVNLVVLVVEKNDLPALEPVRPASIVGGPVVFGDVVRLVVQMPDAAIRYVVESSTNLPYGGWGRVPHSDDGVHGFIVTNLSYSSAGDAGRVIYVRLVDALKFFRVVGQ